MADPTAIEMDADVPLVRIIREFDAPTDAVFRAHTDPEIFVLWNGPHGSQTRIDHHDCRTGGSYRYIMAGDGWEAGFRGSFHDVRPSTFIVQTFTYEEMPDGVALEKLSFEDLARDRCRLVTTSLVDSFADRDAFVASGMEQGVREGYSRLDEVLRGT